MSDDELATEAEELFREYEPHLLTTHHPIVQGATLALLLAHWLAKLPAHRREGHFEDHIASVRRMLAVIVEKKEP